MSRVARKKLEKEARKNKIANIFGRKTTKSADLDLDSSLQKNQIDSDIKDKDLDDTNSKLNKKINFNYDIKKLTDDDVRNTNLPIRLNLSETIYSGLMKSDEEAEKTIVNKTKMKTADKIISVEDERMYFERKKKRMEMGIPTEEKVLTVGDILTAEDEGSYIKDDNKIEKPVQNKNEDNINKKKKLSIEQAPFEDVVKVAESRKQAEIEREKQRQLEIEKQEKLEKERELERQQKLKKEKELEEAKRKLEEEKILKLKKQKELEQKTNIVQGDKDSIKEEKKENKKMHDDKIVNDKDDLKVSNDEQISIESNNEGSNSYGDKKGIKKIIIIIVAVLAIIYAMGCIIFHNRYFFNTKINGIEASFKTPSEVDKLAQQRMNGYQITIKGRNNVVDHLTGAEVGLEINSDAGAKKIKEEQGFLGWPASIFNGENIKGKLNVTLNQQKFDEAIKNLNIFKKEYIKEPISAYPVYVESKNDYEINKGDVGSKPITTKVSDFVKKEMISQTLDAIYPNSVYVEQNNKSDDARIKNAIEKMNKYNKLKIEYVFGKNTYILDGKEISKMFNVDSENDYTVTLDKDKVRNFVRSLSKKYSTYGDAREIYSASTGGKLKVTGGSYGWLIDREKETDALMKILEDGKDVKGREPIYAQTAISRENGDLGNEYIEIDLTKQHMWFVKDGKVEVSTPIVSGNPNKGDETPPGIYPITYKQRNAVLRGPGYASPVSYWMPFNGSIGIHDSSWQPAYGGKRYLFAGSHGCINTPLSKVAEIYKLSKEGMPVIVHY